MDNICTKDYRAEQVACNSAFVLVGSDILDSDLGCGDPSWSNLLHVRSFQSVNSGTSKFCEGNLGTPDVVVRVRWSRLIWVSKRTSQAERRAMRDAQRIIEAAWRSRTVS